MVLKTKSKDKQDIPGKTGCLGVVAPMISSWNQDREKIIAEIINISKFKELAPGILPKENQPRMMEPSISELYPYLYSNTKERDKQ